MNHDEIPSQYMNARSTRRRICECIDNLGPMTVAELSEALQVGISGIRIQATLAEADGFLLTTLVKVTNGRGRAQHRFSRTSIELPALPEPAVFPVGAYTEAA